MGKKKGNFKFDFMLLGLAIKQGREAKHLSREKLTEIVNYSTRYLQSVEIEGQMPSIELFIQLVTLLDISADEHLFKDKRTTKSSIRKRIDTLLDPMSDKGLIIVEAVIKGIVGRVTFTPNCKKSR